MQYTLFGGRKIMTANGFRWLAVGWMVVAAFGAMPAAAQPVVLAQPGQPAQAGRMQRPYASPWSGSIQWLAMPEVQKDLELIDDQIEKINKIRQELQQEMQSSYKTLSSVPGEERQQKYYDLSVELSERTEKKLMEVLLPEQQDRLRQISLQMRLRNYYALGQQLTSEDLTKKLGISAEQKDRLLGVAARGAGRNAAEDARIPRQNERRSREADVRRPDVGSTPGIADHDGRSFRMVPLLEHARPGGAQAVNGRDFAQKNVRSRCTIEGVSPRSTGSPRTY
jgi:hypothetical protein